MYFTIRNTAYFYAKLNYLLVKKLISQYLLIGNAC